MVRIVKISIENFRTIHALEWMPASGINCLIGPSDSGKSTILDAIDLCLGARRSLSFEDTDFYCLDVSHPIRITLTLAALPESLQDIDRYGYFLQGFDRQSGQIEPEPRTGLETVLTLCLTVDSELEPVWLLVSPRAAEAGIERSIAWKDRQKLAPARLGTYTDANLSWSRGSVLNRLAAERLDMAAALAEAARDARAGFGNKADAPLAGTLQIVRQTSNELGVPAGIQAKALLDVHSVSIGDGAIALHDERGVPLRAMGTGSSRLLVAGLQRKAAQNASVVLVDEVEFGLEPHRLNRLLHSLGAKDASYPLQVFMTTHSPVALRELNGSQLFVVRKDGHANHQVMSVGEDDDVQSTIRKEPEAFLSQNVIVCEGASEIGLVRGIDQFNVSMNFRSLLAAGTGFVDVGGGDPAKCFIRAMGLLSLGYRVRVLMDADKAIPAEKHAELIQCGGELTIWREGRALEDELFLSLPDDAIDLLIRYAVDLHSAELVSEHIRSCTQGQLSLECIYQFRQRGEAYAPQTRQLLATTSRNRRNGWFKSISRYEHIARNILGPHSHNTDPGFIDPLKQLFGWALNG